jgi:DNA polymerase
LFFARKKRDRDTDTEKKEEHLRWEITHCTKCDLHLSRTHAVPGEGPLHARVFLIGEGPGREEDRRGLPFVGKAGRVLDVLLDTIGLDRKTVFITSVVKCHPPGNRAPTREESRICRPYLMRQLALRNPTIVVPMGRWASWDVFEIFDMEDRPVGDVHGTPFRIVRDGTERFIHPTYHPAVVTHNPKMRSALEQDFRSLEKTIKRMDTPAEEQMCVPNTVQPDV